MTYKQQKSPVFIGFFVGHLALVCIAHTMPKMPTLY